MERDDEHLEGLSGEEGCIEVAEILAEMRAEED